MALDRKRILVIDDSSTIRSLVGDMLSKNGYQTLEAATVEIVFDDMGRMHFDLAIIDIFMPGMGGIEGIAKIKGNWPDIKIIAISAGFEGMDKDKALRAAALQGADGVLAKPFTEEELTGMIGEVLIEKAEGETGEEQAVTG